MNSKIFAIGLLLAVLTSIPITSSAGTLAVAWRDRGPETTSADLLAQYDLVILVDNSNSMNKTDCPPAGSKENIDLSSRYFGKNCLSRWKWSEMELRNFQEKVLRPLQILSFASQTKQAASFRDLFDQNHPYGGTNTTGAIRQQIENYFARSRAPHAKPKPLLLAVLSDGCTDNPSMLRHTIVDASKKLKAASEMQIVFLQIGNDKDGTQILERLDSGLMRQAKFDIVSTVSYPELLSRGINSTLQDLVARKNHELAM